MDAELRLLLTTGHKTRVLFITIGNLQHGEETLLTPWSPLNCIVGRKEGTF